MLPCHVSIQCSSASEASPVKAMTFDGKNSSTCPLQNRSYLMEKIAWHSCQAPLVSIVVSIVGKIQQSIVAFTVKSHAMPIV